MNGRVAKGVCVHDVVFGFCAFKIARFRRSCIFPNVVGPLFFTVMLLLLYIHFTT